jgi:hypothetical protein
MYEGGKADYCLFLARLLTLDLCRTSDHMVQYSTSACDTTLPLALAYPLRRSFVDVQTSYKHNSSSSCDVGLVVDNFAISAYLQGLSRSYCVLMPASAKLIFSGSEHAMHLAGSYESLRVGDW